MPDVILKSVQTLGIGFAPILRCYFDRCSIREIIDKHVFLDSRRKVLSHGEACIAMISGILFQVLQLYRFRSFATDTTVLEVTLPYIASHEYFDDRPADTLDAIYDYGIRDLEMLLTKEMISEFSIKNDICHNDTTSASVYGDYNTKISEGVHITFGHSKKHREDLKQFIKEIKQDIGSSRSQTCNPYAVINHLNFSMMAATIIWIYGSRLETIPERRHKVKGRNSFAFSDLSHIIANAALSDDFDTVCNRTQKLPRKSFVEALLRMVG